MLLLRRLGAQFSGLTHFQNSELQLVAQVLLFQVTRFTSLLTVSFGLLMLLQVKALLRSLFLRDS